MSTDIQAPDLRLNMRHSTGDKKMGGQNEESQGEDYKNEDLLKHRNAYLESHKVRPLSQNRSHFTTATILGVTYLLISAGIFMRYILATLDKEHLAMERERLNISLNQAQTTIINLTEEKDELQTKYNVLSKDYSQLQHERNKLKAQLAARAWPSSSCMMWLPSMWQPM